MAGSGMLPRPCRRLGSGRNGCGRVGRQGEHCCGRASVARGFQNRGRRGGPALRRRWWPAPGVSLLPDCTDCSHTAPHVVVQPRTALQGGVEHVQRPSGRSPRPAAHLALRRGARLLARPVGRAGMQPALRQRPQGGGHDHRGYHAAYRCLHSLCTVSGVEAAQRRRLGPPAMSITAACRTGQAGQEAIPLATGV